MLVHRHDFFRALDRARKATRAGDHAAAGRWTRIAERHLAIAQRLDTLAAPPASASPSSSHKGPIMLDPDGFSPGGMPNWALNKQRLERAGLNPSLAPKPGARCPD